MAFCLVPFTTTCQYTSRYQAMYVNVAAQILSPGMQHRRHAQLSTKVPCIASELVEGIPDGLEQAAVEYLRMQLNPAVQGMGQRKYQVEVGNRQQQGSLTVAPLLARAALALRAMSVTTAVITDRAGLAVITLHFHAAHAGRPALGQPGTDLAVMAVQWLIGEELIQNGLNGQ